MQEANSHRNLSGRPERSPRLDPRRPGAGSRLSPEFHAALAILAGLRSDYETLRSADGSFERRAKLLTELQAARAQAAGLAAPAEDLT